MKLPRRKFLHLTAGTAALSVGARFAWAQTYPSRPARIIVGFPPGTTASARSLPALMKSIDDGVGLIVTCTCWFGIGAPNNTPVKRIEKLNREINADLSILRSRSGSRTSALCQCQ
jgi:tripartite-type tricarboxylate transporter receptor subunit TctC